MILTVPHVKRNEIMSTKSKETLRIIRGEVLSIEVIVDNMYEDNIFFVGIGMRETNKWYVKVKMVLSYHKEHREDIEIACVYVSKHHENAAYVGKRLLEKFYKAMDEETKIDIAGMVKGILIEAHLADEPEPESTDDEDEDTDGIDDGEEVPEDTVEKWGRDDLPTDGNSTGNGEDLIKRYEFTFPEGQFTRCGTETVVTFSNGRITERK